MNEAAIHHHDIPEALEFWQWMERVAAGSDCLTIADVKAFTPGQRVPVLVMDRNLCDHVYPDIRSDHRPVLDAHLFFDPARDGAVYVHKDGLHGYMEWGWDREREHIHEAFEFELEYAPDHWYPLENGILPAKDPQGFASFEYDAPRPWYTFPDDTRVGWRGPMLHWERLVNQPRVFTEIDLDQVAASAALRSLERGGAIPRDRHPQRNYLKRVDGRWVLTVRGISHAELEQLQHRLPDVEIQRKWIQSDRR